MRESSKEDAIFPEVSVNEDLLIDAVHGNDWRTLQPPEIGGEENNFVDHVSVILPCYMGQKELALTFAGLSKQTYPKHLIEIIVVDDGSDPPIKLPSQLPFETSVIVQKRDGFGLARARNLGAEHAQGQILIFLDCDMIPEPQLIEAHSRWHHVNEFALTLGFRNHADFSGISPEDVVKANGPEGAASGRKVTTPKWIEFHMVRTKNLTSDDCDLFRIATGGNLGVRKSFFEEIGGFDSSFRQWGGEDIEFGFRAFNSGGVLIPERLAKAWHQGEGASPDPNEQASLEQQRNRLSHLIAERTFRNSLPGRSFLRPMLAVSIKAGEQEFESVASQIEAVLSSTFHDLVVGLEIPEFHPDGINLERQYGPDPRVVITEDVRKEFPFASFHLEAPVGFCFRPDDIRRLLDEIKKYGVVRIDLGAQGEIRLARTRALKRSEQVGIVDSWYGAGVLFKEKVIKGEIFGVSENTGRNTAPSGPSLNPPVWELASKARKKIVSIRSLNDLITVIRWTIRGLWNVSLRVRFFHRIKNFGGHQSSLHVPDWLRLVGEASHFPHARPWMEGASGVEVILVAPEAADQWDSSLGRSVFLGEKTGIPLAPPINSSLFNPIGFRHVNNESLIGPVPEFKNDADFIRKSRSLLAAEIEKTNSPESAISILKLSALGVPVVVKDMTDAEAWLGSSMVSALNEVVAENLGDQTERERISVQLRRAALHNHSHSQRLKQVREAAGLTVFKDDPVSVVVATKRPENVERIFKIVESQDYKNLELILALHGDGFRDSYSDLEGRDLPVAILRFSEKVIFGDVLSEASLVSQGNWIAKMDDDDWYGREHISDLILASTYSHADLIGKGSEFVYLTRQDQTIRRDLGDSEVESRTIGGGSLLVRAELLKRVNGWRSLSKGVDVALIDDVILSGGIIWRTHPFGYLLRRTEGQHTWEVDERYFLRHADQKWEGLANNMVGVSEDL